VGWSLLLGLKSKSAPGPLCAEGPAQPPSLSYHLLALCSLGSRYTDLSRSLGSLAPTHLGPHLFLEFPPHPHPSLLSINFLCVHLKHCLKRAYPNSQVRSGSPAIDSLRSPEFSFTRNVSMEKLVPTHVSNAWFLLGLQLHEGSDSTALFKPWSSTPCSAWRTVGAPETFH